MKKNVLIISLCCAVVIIAIWILSSYQSREKPHFRVSGALEALSLMSYQRAYPNSDIPNAAHYKAYEFSKRNLKKPLSRTETVAPWESMGPHNKGGRTLAIAFNPQNPNTVYAGSASGGLWRSYSGGVGASAWEIVPTGFPVLAVSSIAVAPDDSNVIYIGTGEVYNYQATGMGAAYRLTRGTYGIGILKTENGGASWCKSLDWSFNQQHGVWAIKINPMNSSTIWAATTEGTYKSLDGGITWQRVLDVIMANDLIINPADTNIVVVGCGNFASEGHGIYRTTDGGKAWEKITQGLPETFGGKIHLALCQSSPEMMYASIGNGYFVGDPQNATWLCMSFDAGKTWGNVSVEDYSLWQGWFSHDVAVHPQDYNTVIAIGIDIWKSTTMGCGLQQKSSGGGYAGQIPPGDSEGPPYHSHVDHHDVAYHTTNPDIIYFANDGGVFRSLDGGETFEGCNGGYQTAQFYNGFSCSQQDSNLAIGGLQDNNTIIYRGSKTWHRYVLAGDGCCAGIDATNDSIMYGSWQGLSISKSSDRGYRWSRIQPPGANRPTCFVAPFALGIDETNVIYAGRDVVYKSTDRGAKWTATNGGESLDGNPVFCLAVSHQNSDVAYAATAPYQARPGIFRTFDGGISWVNITADLPDRFPGDLAVDPANDSTVYIVLLGFGSSHVFKSIDAGANWSDIGQGLPDLPTSAIVIDPEHQQNIYIGNDLGVYVSLDGGANWQEFQEGLPDAVIAMDLAISPVNRKLRVATHGNGAYERDLLDALPSHIAHDKPIARDFVLEQNYPNPFNATTKIRYWLPKSSRVNLIIYNSLGQEVKTLVENKYQEAGNYTINWDGTNNGGIHVSGNTYIYRLNVDNLSLTKKMTLLK
ncbi:T9SS type A sorting domain-containing protein [candidate division KSB1 bacterium]|nr:T9SS type A sorting domain-containing protein [candidate division KSB1 bacterium]